MGFVGGADEEVSIVGGNVDGRPKSLGFGFDSSQVSFDSGRFERSSYSLEMNDGVVVTSETEFKNGGDSHLQDKEKKEGRERKSAFDSIRSESTRRNRHQRLT